MTTDQAQLHGVGKGIPALGGLRDELEVLLRSLEDLDAEHAAGDMDRADYLELKDDYTVRAADLSRRIDQLASGGSVDDLVDADQSTSNGGRSRWLRPVLVVGIAGVFAVTAGLFLARFAGERGVNDELTGNIEASTRQQSFECQELSGGGDIVGALECYDDVLTKDPDNLEALTYRGWLLVLTSASAEQAGNVDQAQELLEGGMVYLDRAVAQDPTFLDARAFRASTYDRQGRVPEACAEVAALLALDPPDFFVQQTAGIMERNNCSSRQQSETG